MEGREVPIPVSPPLLLLSPEVERRMTDGEKAGDPTSRFLSRGRRGGGPPVGKTQAHNPTDKPEVGWGPAREGGFRRRGWDDPHAHHMRQRNPKHLRRQGH